MLDNEVWLKFEGANPTGSFKDRGMTMAISKAAEEGAKAVICASTGNTSASAAAYATKAGMLEISRHIGKAIKNISQMESRNHCHRCGAFKQKAPLRLCAVKL